MSIKETASKFFLRTKEEQKIYEEKKKKRMMEKHSAKMAGLKKRLEMAEMREEEYALQEKVKSLETKHPSLLKKSGEALWRGLSNLEMSMGETPTSRGDVFDPAGIMSPPKKRGRKPRQPKIKYPTFI